MVCLVGRRQHLRLVDVVDLERLEHLRLDEVADPRLRHHRDADRLLDAGDHLGVGHPRDAAVAADVGGHAFERHHRRGARLLGDRRLLGRHDVHDHAALQHLGQAALDPECRLVAHAAILARVAAGPPRLMPRSYFAAVPEDSNLSILAHLLGGDGAHISHLVGRWPRRR